jgi:hypothetical protein
VFGFASNGRKFKINLVMSLRAHLFLREEYPATIPLMKYDNEKKEYQIEIMVNNLAPVKRFMKGLENEVKGELIEVY